MAGQTGQIPHNQTVSSLFWCKIFGTFLLEHLLFLGLKKLNKSIKTTSSFGRLLFQAKKTHDEVVEYI
jgi:hypothetical protein